MADENAPLAGSDSGTPAAEPASAPVTETTETKAPEAPAEGAATAQTPPEGGEPAAPASEQPEDEARQAQKRSVSERIKQLTQRRREAEASAEQATAEAARLRERLAHYETTPPDRYSFDTDEAYQAALIAHSVKQVTREDRESDLAAVEQRAQAAGVEASAVAKAAFDARANVFAERVPDFHAKVNDPTLPISPETAAQIQASESGPAIAYYLASNRAEAARLAGLASPLDVAREIGRIEGRLTKPAPKTVTSAPPPMEQVAAGSGSMGQPSVAAQVRKALYPNKYDKGRRT